VRERDQHGEKGVCVSLSLLVAQSRAYIWPSYQHILTSETAGKGKESGAKPSAFIDSKPIASCLLASAPSRALRLNFMI
jgi:hypothetical protein